MATKVSIIIEDLAPSARSVSDPMLDRGRMSAPGVGGVAGGLGANRNPISSALAKFERVLSELDVIASRVGKVELEDYLASSTGISIDDLAWVRDLLGQEQSRAQNEAFGGIKQKLKAGIGKIKDFVGGPDAKIKKAIDRSQLAVATFATLDELAQCDKSEAVELATRTLNALATALNLQSAPSASATDYVNTALGKNSSTYAIAADKLSNIDSLNEPQKQQLAVVLRQIADLLDGKQGRRTPPSRSDRTPANAHRRSTPVQTRQQEMEAGF